MTQSLSQALPSQFATWVGLPPAIRSYPPKVPRTWHLKRRYGVTTPTTTPYSTTATSPWEQDLIRQHPNLTRNEVTKPEHRKSWLAPCMPRLDRPGVYRYALASTGVLRVANRFVWVKTSSDPSGDLQLSSHTKDPDRTSQDFWCLPR